MFLSLTLNLNWLNNVDSFEATFASAEERKAKLQQWNFDCSCEVGSHLCIMFLIFVFCSQPVWSYSLIWLPGLRSASSTACRKWQKSKSNCSSPPTYSSLYGFLEGNWTLRYDILQGVRSQRYFSVIFALLFAQFFALCFAIRKYCNVQCAMFSLV